MWWMLAPGFVVLLLVFYIPLVAMVTLSVARRIPESFQLTYWPPTLEHFAAIFDPMFATVLWTTARVIGGASLLTLILGFPLALLIHGLDRRYRSLAMTLLMIPFFANFLARIYAWFLILKPNGILQSLHIGQGDWLNTEFGLILGIVSTYLPFFVYPVYFSLEKLDLNLIDASRNLGASTAQVLLRIVIPLTIPGLVAGLVLVALPALGEFIIAKMVGGGLIPLAAMVIETSFLGKVTPNWPFGAAMSVLVMVIVSLGLAAMNLTVRKVKA